ncbi:MAG: hypothetical protein IKC75_00355 [Clostridia bacterium]|nr:hypothetical protein [Clostridia bacterium]
MFLQHILMIPGGLMEFARSAVVVLIAILAIYLSIRLLGKLAKFVITVVVVVAVGYFLMKSGFLSDVIGQIKSALDLGAMLL